jgi:transcriptional regulator with XRE-family HTH domain
MLRSGCFPRLAEVQEPADACSEAGDGRELRTVKTNHGAQFQIFIMAFRAPIATGRMSPCKAPQFLKSRIPSVVKLKDLQTGRTGWQGRRHSNLCILESVFAQPLSPGARTRICASRIEPHFLDMSQEKLADAFGITFQQVQKYEKGTNRISASRLQHAANLLQIPIQFFFEGAPVGSGTQLNGSAPAPAYVNEFVSSSDGLSLIKAFTRIEGAVRRRIVDLVQEIAADDGE